jgi:transposase
MSKIKFTKKQFEKLFPNDDICLDFLFRKKYANITECPKCIKPFKYYKIRHKKFYCCQFCGHDISPAANTIFHK